MQALLKIGLLALLLTVGSMKASWADSKADFTAGFEAYQRGDYETAMRKFRPLAEKGYGNAEFFVYLMYENGQGVAKDSKEAAKWVGKRVQNMRALEYKKKGYSAAEAKNYGEAYKWYRKAAELGNVEALTDLGKFYQNGWGVAKSYTDAMKWYRRAAELGDPVGQYLVGLMYENGQGVAKDPREAASWYLKAALQGDAHAQTNLGSLYRQGLGVAKNYLEAVNWYGKAVKQGNEEAIKLLKQLRYELQQEEKSAKEIERIALEIVARKFSAQRKKSAIDSPKNKQSAISSQIAFPANTLDLHFKKSRVHPDDIAVIVGNANYKKLGKDIPDVVPAYADADGFKQWVIQAKGVREGNIIFLKDATSAQMESIFGNNRSYKGQLFNWVKPDVSNVYIYYSGHGAPASDGSNAFLVPSDSNSATIELTGYPLSTLYKNLKNLPAKSITVVLAACFSGASQNGYVISRTSGILVTPRIPIAPGNLTVISAGQANQISSWEQDNSNGLFTKYFLHGMSGKADKSPYGNGDGDITYAELGKYLDGTMTYYARSYYGRDQDAQIVMSGR